jgi:hypothetical protein
MTEGAWSRFLEYAAHARTKPAFDAEERDWKLDVARRLRAGLERAGEGDGDWVEDAIDAVKRSRPPFITSNGQRRWMREWALSGDEALREALAGFLDPELDPVESFSRFAHAAEGFEPQTGTWRLPLDLVRASSVLAFGSLFNFAVAPGSVPIVRAKIFEDLERLLGVPTAETGSLASYRTHLELAGEVQARLEGRGVPVRDMVDVQSLISIAVEEASLWTADPPADWEERARRALGPDQAYAAICAVYLNEAPYLPEWIEFHRLMGIERFFLYDNGSTDSHLEVLAPYLESGVVVRHEWPSSPPNQGEIYSDCLRRHRTDARWIAFIDVDEFLFSPTGRPLGEVLREYEPWPGIAVSLATFSYSGHRTRPSGLVIDNYTLMDTKEIEVIKQIVDPLRTLQSDSVHWFVFEYGLPVDENGWPVGLVGQTKVPSFERLRINHYPSKSAEEARAKVERAPSWKHLARWRLADLRGDLELVEDNTIRRWAPAVRARLANVTAASRG